MLKRNGGEGIFHRSFGSSEYRNIETMRIRFVLGSVNRVDGLAKIVSNGSLSHIMDHERYDTPVVEWIKR